MSSVALQELCQVRDNNPDDVTTLSSWLSHAGLGDTFLNKKPVS